MSERDELSRRRFITGVSGAAAGAAIGGAVVSSPAYAQPITYMPGFSGPANFAHGDTVTINGPGGTNQGFGTKAKAAPLVFDDTQGQDDPLDLWDYKTPKLNGDPNLWMKRRNWHRGVQHPYLANGRYLAGCHNPDPFGTIVAVRKGWPAPSLPFNVYASYWGREDPNWVFGGPGSGSDNNFKMHRLYEHADFPGSTGPTHTTLAHPVENADGPTTGGVVSINDTQVKWHLGDSVTLDPRAWYGPFGAVNPMTKWTFFEIEWHNSTANSFIRIYENGVLRGTYNGQYVGDPPGPYVAFEFGGYARQYGANTVPNNWRYFTDLYLDDSLGRMVIGNDSTLATSTKRSVQLPSAWTDTSITFKCLRGAHGTLAGKYLYVKSARTPNNAIKVATIG